MTISARLCLALSIVCWMVPATTLANRLPASPQQTPSTPPAAADKQPDTPAKPHTPRPNPDASGKYHVGDGVTTPKLIHSVEPKFSEKMRKAHSSGICLVAVTVDTDGNPSDVHILRSTPETKDEEPSDFVTEMEDICISAVQQYRFNPAMYQGKPVPIDLKVEINFKRSASQP